MTRLQTKSVEIRVKFVCVTWMGNTEKILELRVGPNFGLIRCSVLKLGEKGKHD